MNNLNDELSIQWLRTSGFSLDDGGEHKLQEIRETINSGAAANLDFTKLIDEVPGYLKDNGIDFETAKSLIGNKEAFDQYVKQHSNMAPSVVKGIVEYRFIPDDHFRSHMLTDSKTSNGFSWEHFNNLANRVNGIDAKTQAYLKIDEKATSQLGDNYKPATIRKPDYIVDGIEHNELKCGNHRGKKALNKFNEQVGAEDVYLSENKDGRVVYRIAESFNGASILDDPRKIDSIIKLYNAHPGRASVTYAGMRVSMADLKNYGTMLEGARLDRTFERLDNYVVFDIEHTAAGDVIQISAYRVKNGKIVGEPFNMLVKPDTPIDWRTRELTGITDKQVADKPSQKEALQSFKEWAGNDVLLGYNIRSSDMKVFDKLFNKSEVKFTNDISDVLQLVRQLPDDINIRGQNGLGKVCERLGISNENAHDALADSKMTFELYEKIKDQIEDL